MKDKILEFAEWMDKNKDTKFRSTVEAYQFWKGEDQIENEITKVLTDMRENKKNSKVYHSNDELTLEIFERALKHPNGEFFYLVYTPDDENGIFMDMGTKGGEELINVLATYHLTKNQAHSVDKFSNIVTTIIMRANFAITQELKRRMQSN